MIADFLLTVLYSQIIVAVPGAAAGGLLWTDDHVAQGFAWSPGLVSFGVPDHDGQVRVVVQRSTTFRVFPDTLWAVQTPLDIVSSFLTVDTVGGEREVPVTPGRYNLVFEVRSPPAPDEGVAYVAYIHLIETSAPRFEILEQGDELETDRVLSTAADPA